MIIPNKAKGKKKVDKLTPGDTFDMPMMGGKKQPVMTHKATAKGKKTKGKMPAGLAAFMAKKKK